MRNFFVLITVFFVLSSHATPMAIGSVSASDSVYTTNSLDTHSLFIARDTLPFVADTSYHHSWKRATIWSACLPGAGQIYNEIGYRRVQDKRHRAWWKAPIIYGALGVTGYYFYQNLATARALKAEWIFRQENPNQFLYPEYNTWSDSELLSGNVVGGVSYLGFDDAAKRRDMLAFGFMAIWGLQVVEALVDGHFVTFDVSEDLTFSWSPTMLNYTTPGVALRLNIN
ncbi:MAG: hypothetical protein HYZ14_12710 [Bacteroidetes bacterium]|nr:hypothetical protein [Bacteroidota bacterium]